MNLVQKFDKGLAKKADKKNLGDWKTGEDAENLSRMLVNFMTNPSYFGPPVASL